MPYNERLPEKGRKMEELAPAAPSFKSELAKSLAISLAVTAGTMVGLFAVGYVSNVIKKKRRTHRRRSR
jgi:sulfite exporter TauE/SafE